LITNIVNFLIQKIKKTPDYTLDEKLTSGVIILVLIERLSSLVRGVIFQLIRFRKPVIMFKGKRTKIRYSSQLKLSGTATIGSLVTLECLGKKGIELGENINIPDGCFIRCTGVISELGIGIKIGNNTGLGHNNFINAQGGVEIGDDVIIGPYVKILSENHVFDDINKPIRTQGVTRQGIKIEDDVWVGANVTILDGVTIGRGSVIGAGSVVCKSIPRLSVAVGIPCKVIKKRENKDDG
jgi:acetyltransferase-like isoleucine patch superfamily enzyme